MSLKLTLCPCSVSRQLFDSSVAPPSLCSAFAHTRPPALGCASSPPPDPGGPEFSLSGWSAYHPDTADRRNNVLSWLGALPRGCGQTRPSHLQLGQWGHHVLPVALKLAAGVPHQKKFSQVAIFPQMLHAAQATYKVHRQVQLLEALAVCREKVVGIMDPGLLVRKTVQQGKLLLHLPGFQWAQCCLGQGSSTPASSAGRDSL